MPVVKEKKKKREVESANASPFIGGRRYWFSPRLSNPKKKKKMLLIITVFHTWTARNIFRAFRAN